MRLSGRLAVALLSVMCLVAACSSSSSQSGGGWPDSSVEGGDATTGEAGDDTGSADGPASDVGPPACPCGAAFKTCPASRPCVIGVATTSSCAGQVCCGPASACDGGDEAGDAGGRPDADAGRSDADAGKPRDAGGDRG